MQIHSILLPLLTLYIVLLLSIPVDVWATFPDNGCSCPEPTYTTGSTFQSNLQQLLLDLPRNAPQNNYSYNVTYGKSPDQVYGLAMCYADAKPDECNTCLSDASTGIIECCGLKKSGVAWYHACMMRYSFVPFNSSNNIGLMISYHVGDKFIRQNLTDPAKYAETFQQLIDDLARNASKSPLKIAAGTKNYTLSENIYALVQCTRQLQPSECRSCVGALADFKLELLNGTSSDLSDLGLTTASCYVRYSFYPFYVVSEAHPPWPNTGICSLHIPPFLISQYFHF
jgi:Salt stress response/antifungal